MSCHGLQLQSPMGSPYCSCKLTRVRRLDELAMMPEQPPDVSYNLAVCVDDMRWQEDRYVTTMMMIHVYLTHVGH